MAVEFEMTARASTPDTEGTLRPDAEETMAPPAEPTPSSGPKFSGRVAEPAISRLPSSIPGTISLPPELLPEPPRPGGRVGRYFIERTLGQGGMGQVLLGRDDILQRDVAIKVILPGYLASDPTAGLRFLREAEIVARLRHPHIVRVLDAGLDSGIAYLVFEFVSGTSFSDLRAPRGMPVSQAVDLLVPIVSAVQTAHATGVVHGDIKPTNLLLGEDYAERPFPYILDFGVSFFTELDAGLDPTRGRINGTAGYMAPEWLDGPSVDGRVDCFSLGCVLYELIVGRGPFYDCKRLVEATRRIRGRDYERISAIASVPPSLEAIIDRCLAPTPQERFPNLGELGRALLPFAVKTSSFGPDFESTAGDARLRP